MENPVKRIAELRDKILDADYKYYVLAEPDIDDYEYDMMMKELERLEKEYLDGLKKRYNPEIYYEKLDKAFKD